MCKSTAFDKVLYVHINGGRDKGPGSARRLSRLSRQWNVLHEQWGFPPRCITAFNVESLKS